MLGFAEKHWLQVISSKVNLDSYDLLDYNEQLKKYSKMLKDDLGCEIIIALTHMKIENDIIMAQNADS